MDNMQKVAGISKDNYKAVCDRANQVKAIVRDTFEETGGKPSLGFLQKQFNMSKKALQRHVRNTLESLGQDPASVPTTSQLPRKKAAQPEQAQIEESDETPDTEETPAVEVAEHEETEEPITN